MRLDRVAIKATTRLVRRAAWPAIQPGWRAASAHDTTARATIRQARRATRQGLYARHSAGARERGLRHGSLGPATRPALDETRPGQGP